MNMEKKKNTVKHLLGSSSYVRWAILISVTTIFSLFLYPNLVIKEQVYEIGDVAERDIKATKDFLIEDYDATEINRRQARENVLTVYDYNSTLYSKLNQQIHAAFENIRTVYNADIRLAEDEIEPSETDLTAETQQPSVSDLVWEKKPEFQEKLGVAISDGAFNILEKEAFSQDIESYIDKILSDIFGNGVVTNKELFLKEMDKGIILRDIKTKS